MAVREGKVYIYCIECAHYKYSGNKCFSPNNMNINNWKHPIPFGKPLDINKKNDCKWFVKPKWYRAFGWGTSP